MLVVIFNLCVCERERERDNIDDTQSVSKRGKKMDASSLAFLCVSILVVTFHCCFGMVRLVQMFSVSFQDRT